MVVDELSGVRTIGYTMPNVLLAPKGYSLSVSLMQQDGKSEWERVAGVLDFEVVPGRIQHRGGYLLSDGDWSVAAPVTTPDP